MDGSGHGDTNVVPIALARLERMIQLRLADSVDQGLEPAITVKVLEPDLSMPDIQDDPAAYDIVVDKIVETLDQYLNGVADGEALSASALNGEIEAAFSDRDALPRPSDSFVGRLRCMQCGIVTTDPTSFCETFLRAEPDGSQFCLGSEFVFDHEDVAHDYYARAAAAGHGEPTHIVEGWSCPHCDGLNWAEIVIRESLVSSVWSVALSRQVLERAHYVTSECVEFASRITGRPTWSLVGDDVFEILFDELDTH
jgi:hypothetical protein